MKKRLLFPCVATAVACAVALMIAACDSGDDINAPTDSDTVADQRAAALVSQMTTDEKLQLVHGTGFPVFGLGGPFPPGVDGAGYIPGIPRLGIPGLAMAEINTAGTGSISAPVNRGADNDAMTGNAVMYDVRRILGRWCA
ncbi:hypothetical protein OKW41_004971 [Paraburkholderia sp. UCT70]